MQELIIEESHIDLMQAFADKQADGWHIVTGSIGCGSTSRPAPQPTPDSPWVWGGSGHDYFWMAVEKPDTTFEASLTMTIDERNLTGSPEVVDGNRKDGDWVP